MIVAGAEYVFGPFRLKVAERELWQDGSLLAVNRYVFDAIAYLIGHRDRAVGRDELVAAVWGRVEVSDGHLNQVITRGRRALGDDAQAQRLIRTVPGFGYRWVGEIAAEDMAAPGQGIGSSAADAPDAVSSARVPPTDSGSPARMEPSDGIDADSSSAPVAMSVSSQMPTRAEGPGVPPDPLEQRGPTGNAGERIAPVAAHQGRRRAAWIAAVLAAVAAAFFATQFAADPTPQDIPTDAAPPATQTSPLPSASLHAVAVLPVEVDADEGSNWIALGAMDLVAERLRLAGLRVAPSTTVVTALFGSDAPVPPDDHARVRAMLGIGLLVQGEARARSDGWDVLLRATDVDGTVHRAEARRGDAIQAARAAADLLLVALGRTPPGGADAGTDPLQERLQQAQAALLTDRLELARDLLLALPETARATPDVRLRLADIDFRAGRHAEALSAVEAMLDQADTRADPLLLGRLLILRGNLSFRRSDFSAAVKDLDAAVAALDSVDAPLDLCDALTRRGWARVALNDLDGAAADYGRARLLAERAGDPLRMAHVEAGFGQLQLDRNRLDLGLPYLEAAMRQYEAFGVIERVVTLRRVLIDTYASLLRWSQVAPLDAQQWAARERIGDPGLALTITNRHVRLLLAQGRLRDADAAYRDASTRNRGLRPESLRYLHDLHADLAAQQQRPDEVVLAVDAALEHWPRDPTFDRYAHLVLLRQRALLALDRAAPETIEPLLPEADRNQSPLFHVARAEWLQYRQRPDEARAAYEQGLAAAEAIGTPALVAAVAQSYVGWLLGRDEHGRAAELAARVAVWAHDDFDNALLRLRVFHATGNVDGWRLALAAASALAGERSIPPVLQAAPTPPPR